MRTSCGSCTATRRREHADWERSSTQRSSTPFGTTMSAWIGGAIPMGALAGGFPWSAGLLGWRTPTMPSPLIVPIASAVRHTTLSVNYFPVAGFSADPEPAELISLERRRLAARAA